MPTTSLEHKQDYWLGRFQAMASPCELLMELGDGLTANRLLTIAHDEALRIERKFSRYRGDNIIHRINHSAGRPVEVDEETAGLLDYAGQCYELSEGSFDITSGVLREVWRFDGSDRVPAAETIEALLPRIGWDKIIWRRPAITLLEGMEIDLGGIGKEYAVDRVAQLLSRQAKASLLINFGGDLFATGPRRDGGGWVIGIEDPQHGVITPGDNLAHDAIRTFELRRGGVATSGDARRFLLKQGIRYGHILDPRTGWPARAAPRSVTVASGTCTEAGILATLAMLYGAQAEAFLDAQGVEYWCTR